VSDDDEIDYSTKPEFYDPELDDKDEKWIHKKKHGRSDAVLSCPACFTTLCLECQRYTLIFIYANFCILCSFACIHTCTYYWLPGPLCVGWRGGEHIKCKLGKRTINLNHPYMVLWSHLIVLMSYENYGTKYVYTFKLVNCMIQLFYIRSEQ